MSLTEKEKDFLSQMESTNSRNCKPYSDFFKIIDSLQSQLSTALSEKSAYKEALVEIDVLKIDWEEGDGRMGYINRVKDIAHAALEKEDKNLEK